MIPRTITNIIFRSKRYCCKNTQEKKSKYKKLIRFHSTVIYANEWRIHLLSTIPVYANITTNEWRIHLLSTIHHTLNHNIIAISICVDSHNEWCIYHNKGSYQPKQDVNYSHKHWCVRKSRHQAQYLDAVWQVLRKDLQYAGRKIFNSTYSTVVHEIARPHLDVN